MSGRSPANPIISNVIAENLNQHTIINGIPGRASESEWNAMAEIDNSTHGTGVEEQAAPRLANIKRGKTQMEEEDMITTFSLWRPRSAAPVPA